jgi:hypothetical protein
MSVRIPVIDEHEEADFGFEGSTKFTESSKYSTKLSASDKMPFARPKLARKGSETEQRLVAMRERFTALQMMEDGDNDKTEKDDSHKDSPVMFPNTASARWSRLRKVVNWPAQGPEASPSAKRLNISSTVPSVVSLDALDSPRDEQSGKLSPRSKRKILKRPSEGSMKQKIAEEQTAALELDDVALSQVWADGTLPIVPEPLQDLPALSLVSEIDALRSDMYSGLFVEDAQALKVTVSRIPEEVVAERKAEIERLAQEERLIMLDKLRKREEDIDYRETAARDALMAQEAEARRRLDAEKQKVAHLALKKQKTLAQDFRKMREDLEQGIKRQQGAIKENFGRLLIHEEVRVLLLQYRGASLLRLLYARVLSAHLLAVICIVFAPLWFILTSCISNWFCACSDAGEKVPCGFQDGTAAHRGD